MIKLSRIRTDTAIPAAFCGRGRLKKELLLLRGRSAGNLEFSSNQWSPAKKQLKKESVGKCAYCEAPTAVVAHGDVEHFRPKSKYWWLAYSYENYLFACQICNEVYKGDEFPFGGTRLPEPQITGLSAADLEAAAGTLAPDPLVDDPRCARSDYERAIRREKAALLDPYLVDPEPFFAWSADGVLREVRLRARSRTASVKRVFEACETHYGLNREELRQERYKTYQILEAFRDVLQSPGLSLGSVERVKQEIRDMMSDASSYAGMVRYFVRVEWSLGL